MELIEKENGRGEGKSFYTTTPSGKKYSVINIQKIMETAPYYTPEQKDEWFNEWEAMEIIDNELQTDNCFRAKTWEELQLLLD